MDFFQVQNWIDNTVNSTFDTVKGLFTTPVNQQEMFYTQRPIGEDYQAPWAYATITSCQGDERPVEGEREKTFDYYIVLTERFPLPMGGTEGHKHEDFSQFIIEDFSKYDMQGEVLMDAEFK